MNARNELVRVTKHKARLKCAVITTEVFGDEITIFLPVAYNDSQYADFLDNLNFQYNSGFGVQELYGVLWHEDGTWQSRVMDKGLEWWEYHRVPDIPEYLK